MRCVASCQLSFFRTDREDVEWFVCLWLVPFVKLVGSVIPTVAINLPAMCYVLGVMVSLSYSPYLT